jgi:catechol 2,3-dioxygenase-like lactoylglutathione lyase family enzyme
MPAPVIGQINLVVSDLAATLEFYRALGFAVEQGDQPEWWPHHGRVILPDGAHLELDSAAFAHHWNPGFKGRPGNGGAAVLFFSVAARDDVDRLFGLITKAGYASQKAPEDAFWGARYAIVEDPDGNSIGFMSPIDEALRRAPPAPPPQSDFEKDEDRICSTLRWDDVVLPTQLTTADLDTLIFAEVAERWLKVARIVANVFLICESRSIRLNMEVIAARLQKLAEAGQIESQGNLTMWRHSEVRLPSK